MNTGILMRAKQSCTLVREILDLPCKDAFQLISDTLQQQGLKEVMTSWSMYWCMSHIAHTYSRPATESLSLQV